MVRCLDGWKGSLAAGVRRGPGQVVRCRLVLRSAKELQRCDVMADHAFRTQQVEADLGRVVEFEQPDADYFFADPGERPRSSCSHAVLHT